MGARSRAAPWTYAEFARLRRERLGILSDRGVEGAPDLIVEIVSPSTAARDRGVKLERYRYFGVPEYWVVDPTFRLR